MNTWPEHYPEQCPPSHAEPVSGNIFRFIDKPTPNPKDFCSYYDKKPHQNWDGMACQARGLSVFRSKDICDKIAAMVPALKKKKIAVAHLKPKDGVIAKTPSKNSEDHSTL